MSIKDVLEFANNKTLQKLIIEPIKKIPIFFLKPDSFFKEKFLKSNPVIQSISSAIIILTIASAIYAALGLKSGVEESSLLYFTIGTLFIWITYAIFLHFWVYIFGGRNGLKNTIATYIYVISYIQPLLVFLLWIFVSFVPSSVTFRTISYSLGASNSAKIIAKGNFFNDEITQYFRAISGLFIMVYFVIGIRRAHHILLWKAVASVIISFIFFTVLYLFILAIDHFAGIGIIERLTFG